MKYIGGHKNNQETLWSPRDSLTLGCKKCPLCTSPLITLSRRIKYVVSDKYLYYSKINNQWQTTLHQSSVISMATLYRVLAPQVHGDHISGRRRITCQIAWGVNISLPPELLDTPEATGKGEVIPVVRSSSSSDWHTNCKFSKEWFSLSTAVSSATDFGILSNCNWRNPHMSL